MTPLQEPEASTRPASPLSEVTDRLRRAGLTEDDELPPEKVRDTIRLFQCPRCSYPLRNPVTLPCGRTLCRGCLPATRARANISYPATESRLQGFECPFPDCEREHAIADCGADVVLSKVLANAKSVLDEARSGALASRSSMTVRVRDPWAVAGISSMRDPDPPLRVVQGGRLLATYILAEEGELDYLADVSYETVPGTEDHQPGHDAVVLDQLKKAARSEMDCQVCYAMFYDPLTTTCGHTLCRHCLQRALDHAAYCPTCRRPVSAAHIDRRTSPPNERIARIMTTLWPDELEARKEMVAAENTHDDDGGGFDVPIFVCTLAFPHMPTFLHVFEPRYRLMVRRALEGNRRFGMVLPRRARGGGGGGGPGDAPFRELGTLLHIVNAEFLPDGRSVIETAGVSRFRIVGHTVLDGYVVARTERISDVSVAEEEAAEAAETSSGAGAAAPAAEEAAAAAAAATTTAGHDDAAVSPAEDAAGGAAARPGPPLELGAIDGTATRDLVDYCVGFVRRRRGTSVRWLTARMLSVYGECPDDPALLPWWLGSILPLREEEKYRLLGTTSVRERLKICARWIVEWETSRWSLSDCVVS